MFKVVRNTNHPVVKTYMDILHEACKNVGATENVPKEFKYTKKSDVIITDSPLIAIKYILRGFSKNIVWFQGISPEESYLHNHSKIRKYILGRIEKIVLKRAKMILLVSQRMMQHYENKYKIDISKKTVIMPCFNELELNIDCFQIKNKYIKNTFLYVGGLQEWQCFEQIAYIYSEVEKRSKTETEFYIFSSEQEKASAIIQKYKIKNYFIDYVEKEELAARIAGIKYGFIIREDNIINNVATPTKFSNYIANGIIPIYSDALRSFSDYAANKKIGVICNLNDLEEGIQNILSSMKENIDAQARYQICKDIFEDYYNCNNYQKIISRKIQELNI